MEQDSNIEPPLGLPVIETVRRKHRASKTLSAKNWRAMVRAQGSHEAQFNEIMALARGLSDSPSALLGIIRLFGLHLQSAAMTQVFRQRVTPSVTISEPDDLFFDQMWALTEDSKTLDDLAPQQEHAIPVDMLTDTILPWPWHRGRASGALRGLSKEGGWGTWESNHNHSIEMWLPIRVGFVLGGNHSLMAGIALGNTGALLSAVTRDLTRVYPHVECDGRRWIRRYDGKIIGTGASLEAAVIWEIGRLLTQRGR